MALLERMTWQDILAEFIHRMGMNDETASGFPERAKDFINHAYLDICLRWHHYELDQTSVDIVWEPGDMTIILPADTYIVMAWDLFDTESADPPRCWLHAMEYREFRSLSTSKVKRLRIPKLYTRFRNRLLVNAPVDAAYGNDIYYYRRPSRPDFDDEDNRPQIDPLWIEHLLQHAQALAHGAVWRPDLSQYGLQLLNEFVGSVPQSPTREVPLHPIPNTPVRTTPHGGKQ